MPASLQRGLSLLRLLAEHPDGCSFSRCTAHLACPDNSAMRLLSGLQGQGWIRKDSQGHYRLGAQAVSLMRSENPLARLRRESQPFVQALGLRSGHTALCIGWDGGRMISLNRHLHEEGLALQPPGSASNNHPDPPWGWFFMGREHWQGQGRSQLPPARIKAILAELDRLDRDGCCYDRRPDRHRLAAPVSVGGAIIGALAIGGPPAAFTPVEIPRLVREVGNHAQALSSLLA